MCKEKFAIINILDSWKWNQDSSCYMDEIDYYSFLDENTKNKLKKGEQIDCDTATKILLTHHLVYICDRKMDYKHVCKAGGYVISKIVDEYCSANEFDDNGNFITNKYYDVYEFDKFIENHVGSYNKKGIWKHYLKAGIPQRADIHEYFISKGLAEKDFVKFFSFASINDYNCIFESISRCRGLLFGQEIANSKNIQALAKRLFELTYQRNRILKGKNKEKFLDIMHIRPKKEKTFEESKFQLKRLWCVVRDFMYNPIFITCMKSAVGEEKFNSLKNDVRNIEIPGDVWNNNSKFAKCFWNVDDKKFKSSKYIRRNYNEHKTEWGKCLPINFDTTFNFIPKMCSKNECNTCIFVSYSKQKQDSNYKKLCHKQVGVYCTLALYSAGIKHECEGKNCSLLKFFN